MSCYPRFPRAQLINLAVSIRQGKWPQMDPFVSIALLLNEVSEKKHEIWASKSLRAWHDYFRIILGGLQFQISGILNKFSWHLCKRKCITSTTTAWYLSIDFVNLASNPGSEKGVFWKRGLLRKVHFLEKLDNLEIPEILENPQSVENKRKSDHFLEIIENHKTSFYLVQVMNCNFWNFPEIFGGM